MVALIVVCSSLAVVVARMPPRVVRIDEHNIFERVGSTTQERTWSWVVRATENANGIEMELRADPLRSLRLAPTKPDRLLLENGRVPPEQIARARALLRARSLLD